MGTEGSGSEMEIPRNCSDTPHEWDPMEESFLSFLNVTTINPCDVVAIQEGRNPTKENPCRFYDGFSEGCWKGANCMQEHIKHSGPMISARKPKFGVRADKEKITHEIKLLAKEVAPPGSIFKALVSYVKSPEEFFIIPAVDFGCACYQPVNPSAEECRSKDTTYQAGWTNFRTFTRELKEAMKSPKYHRTRNDFADFETITVKLRTSDGNDFWTRGVILETVVLEQGWDYSLKPPYASVFLFDIGKELKISAKELYPLPKLFSKIAPFAAKCTLHGIKPLQEFWSDEAVKRFKDLVKCPTIEELLESTPQVLVQVKRSIQGHNQTVPTVPYSVVLNLPGHCHGGALFVGEELVRTGLAQFEVEIDRMGFNYSSYDILYDSD